MRPCRDLSGSGVHCRAFFACSRWRPTIGLALYGHPRSLKGNSSNLLRNYSATTRLSVRKRQRDNNSVGQPGEDMVPSSEQVQQLPKFTGERIVPGVSPPEFLQEHAARYVFAGPLCRNKKVLDVASGLGYGTDYLRTVGARITGLEIDAESVRYCRMQYPEAEFVCGDAEQLPAHWGAAFDVIVSFETIEHLPHPERFLDGVFHCLRPGGLLVCS